MSQFDFVMANPLFNVSGVDKTKLTVESKRYPLGLPRTDNANYLWIEMFYSALNEKGERASSWRTRPAMPATPSWIFAVNCLSSK